MKVAWMHWWLPIWLDGAEVVPQNLRGSQFHNPIQTERDQSVVLSYLGVGEDIRRLNSPCQFWVSACNYRMAGHDRLQIPVPVPMSRIR